MWQIDTIKKYKNNCDIFVETGTWMGDGIQTALDLGFNHVYSCDIDKDNIVNASNRFKGLSVACFHQSSEEFLKDICPILKKTIINMAGCACYARLKWSEFFGQTIRNI